jgi:hypothetical protein
MRTRDAQSESTCPPVAAGIGGVPFRSVQLRYRKPVHKKLEGYETYSACRAVAGNIALCYADAKKDSTASPFSARLSSLSDVICLVGPKNG